VSRGGAEGEGEKDSPADSELSAGLNPTSAETKSWTLNCLSHPGTPNPVLKWQRICHYLQMTYYYT